MANIIITKNQLETLMSDSKPNLNEGKDGEYMSKQHLFTIATLAYKMWEILEEGEEIDDWMESKIAQAEQGITSVVKAYLYDEYAEKDQKVSGMSKLDYDDLIIGQ